MLHLPPALACRRSHRYYAENFFAAIASPISSSFHMRAVCSLSKHATIYDCSPGMTQQVCTAEQCSAAVQCCNQGRAVHHNGCVVVLRKEVISPHARPHGVVLPKDQSRLHWVTVSSPRALSPSLFPLKENDEGDKGDCRRFPRQNKTKKDFSFIVPRARSSGGCRKFLLL